MSGGQREKTCKILLQHQRRTLNYLRNYRNTMTVIIMRLSSSSLRGVKSLFANKTFRSVKKRMKEQEVHIIYMKEAMEGNEVRDPRL